MEIKLFAQTANVNKYLCEKMIMKEESYIVYLKKKAHMKLGKHNDYQRKLFYDKLNKTRLEESLTL